MTEGEVTQETANGTGEGLSEEENNQNGSESFGSDKSVTDNTSGVNDCTTMDTSVQKCNIQTEELESTEASTSGKSSPVEMCLTKEMVEEEEKLEKKLLEEEEKVEEQMEQDLQKANEEMHEKRFQRLQFLLQKSNLYANYLLSRMTKQKEEEKTQMERRRNRIAAKLEKSHKERDHRNASEVKNTRSRKAQVTDGKHNREETENKAGVQVRSITSEPNDKPPLRRSPRRSLTPEVPEDKLSRRKSLRGSKASSPAKSGSDMDGESQNTSEKGSRTGSRCSTPSLKEQEGQSDVCKSVSSSPMGRSTRSRTSTPKAGLARARMTSARSSRQSSRAVSPTQDENKGAVLNPNKGGVSAQEVADKLNRRRSSRTLQNIPNSVNNTGGGTNGNKTETTDKTPGKKGRKRKSENIENYKISDYFTEAYARAKKAKEEQEEFEGTTPKENNEVSMEEESEDNDKENKSVAQTVPKITVTCEEEGETEKSLEDSALDEVLVKEKRLINGETVAEEQPLLFTGGVLRDYQIEGFKWLKIIYENGINGILADEMGLGKTIQCIALISHIVYQGIVGPFLVCAPLSTVPNWVSEFQRFAPKLPVMLYHGTIQEREHLRQKMRKLKKVQDKAECFPIVVTSYEIVMNDRKYLQHYKWKFLIVDEGHRLKNFQCRLMRELKQYQSTHRLLLTGTPLQNNLSELWSLLNFLLPEIFDDLSSFELWFDVRHLESANINDEIVKNEQKGSVLTMLHQILNPFMLRRMKSDVELRVPPKREVLVYAPLSARQKEMYKAICDNTIRKMVGVEEEVHVPQVDEKGRPKRNARKLMNYEQLCSMVGSDSTQNESDDEEDTKFNSWADVAVQSTGFADNFTSVKPETVKDAQVNVQLRNVMMILRKCTNHPYLIEYPLTPTGAFKVDEALVESSGKLTLLDKMLLEMKTRGHKVLIFSQMTQILDVLQDYCYLRKFSYCRLDGSMKVDERKEQIDSFNTDPEVFVFLLSTRAGGLGLNLTAADTVVIFDSDWNPQNDLQAQDRAHRIGQTKPVLVYRMVTSGTIDQKIVERAAAKRKLEKMVIHKGRFKDASMERMTAKLQPLTPEELIKLLQSVDYDGVVQGRENQVISKRDLNSLLDRSDLWEQMKKRTQDSQSEDKNNNADDAADIVASEIKDLEEIISSPKNKSKRVFKIVDEVQGDHFI